MSFDKKTMLDRLEKMFWLPPDWDGCGTPPICRKVYDIAKQMIEYIEADVDLKIFVGVIVDGSLYCEAYRYPDEPLRSRVEMVVLPDGNIDYKELEDVEVKARGSLLLSYDRINELLR